MLELRRPHEQDRDRAQDRQDREQQQGALVAAEQIVGRAERDRPDRGADHGDGLRAALDAAEEAAPEVVRPEVGNMRVHGRVVDAEHDGVDDRGRHVPDQHQREHRRGHGQERHGEHRLGRETVEHAAEDRHRQHHAERRDREQPGRHLRADAAVAVDRDLMEEEPRHQHREGGEGQRDDPERGRAQRLADREPDVGGLGGPRARTGRRPGSAAPPSGASPRSSGLFWIRSAIGGSTSAQVIRPSHSQASRQPT